MIDGAIQLPVPRPAPHDGANITTQEWQSLLSITLTLFGNKLNERTVYVTVIDKDDGDSECYLQNKREYVRCAVSVFYL